MRAWLPACVALVLRGSLPAEGSDHVQDPAQLKAALPPPVTVMCGGRAVRVPGDMLLIAGRALWCPNAKVATTTLYEVLTTTVGYHRPKVDWSKPPTTAAGGKYHRCYDGRCGSEFQYHGFEGVAQVPQHRHHEICSAFSFTFVRNPWDRVRSAYQDKVLEPSEERQLKLAHSTFKSFLKGVSVNPVDNVHYMPFDVRCATNSFDYSFIGKLEDDFDGSVRDVIKASGLHGLHTHVLTDAAALANGTDTARTVTSAEAAKTALHARDARGARVGAKMHQNASTPITVPHMQDSHYSSGLQERQRAYLEAPGLSSPRELVNLVGRVYSADIWPFGYTFDT